MKRHLFLLKEYVEILQDKIDDALKETGDDFTKGRLFAYYDMVTVLKEQAGLFALNESELGLDKINENRLLL